MAKNSKNQLPGIALEKGEHLVLVIKRSKLIPVGFWAGAFLCSAVLIAASILVNGGSSLLFNMDAASRSFFLMIILVYLGNCLYVTNKRLIQNTVNSLFSSSTNVIDLVAVEDVSFKQAGIFEHFFSIGTLRMSTIGSETTYTFSHVDTPTDELETITHLVHIEKGEATDACPTDSLTALRNAGRVIRSAAQNNAGNTPAGQNENLDGTTIVAANTAIINPAAGTVSVEPPVDPTTSNTPDTSSNTFNTPNTLS